jgi:hypothetical protein
MLKTAGTGSAPRGRVTVVPEAPQTYRRAARLANRTESYTAGQGAFSRTPPKTILSRYLHRRSAARRIAAGRARAEALTPGTPGITV